MSALHILHTHTHTHTHTHVYALHYICTKLHMPDTNYLSVISIRPTAKKFLDCRHFLSLPPTQHYCNKVTRFSNSYAIHHLTTLK